jgi:trigger factor
MNLSGIEVYQIKEQRQDGIMQIKIEEKSNIKRVLSIEFSKEEIAVELDKAYGELKKTADIKGFRKGKIPRKVLENRFAKNIHAELVQRLVNDAYKEAIEQHNLAVIGNPITDPPELDPANAYAFDITVEVKPELDDVELDGIALNKTKYEVSDEQMKSQLYMVQKSLAKKETVTEARPVKENDFVLIDYEGFLDGAPYDKTPKIENYMLSIERSELPKEFSEKLIGSIPVQDLEIEVAYAENNVFDDLKGKTILYKVQLKEIKEEILPELNDDMVKELGKFETLEELKAQTQSQLEEGYAQRVRHELAEQIFQHLLAQCQFEVPQAYIEGELNGIIRETEQAYAANNVTLESAGLSKDAMRIQYRGVAEQQARRHIILDKVITQEKLELSDEELEKSFEKMALGMNISIDVVKNFLTQNENQLANYKYTRLADKVIDIIIAKGNITEVEPRDEQVQDNTEDTTEDSKEENSPASDDNL